jgi:hypothetical protein
MTVTTTTTTTNTTTTPGAPGAAQGRVHVRRGTPRSQAPKGLLGGRDDAAEAGGGLLLRLWPRGHPGGLGLPPTHPSTHPRGSPGR